MRLSWEIVVTGRNPSPPLQSTRRTTRVGVMPMITTVNRKGQVTIPKSLRAYCGFPPGTKVVWLERDGDLIPKPLLSVEQLRDRFKGDELTAMLLDERDRDRTHEDG